MKSTDIFWFRNQIMIRYENVYILLSKKRSFAQLPDKSHMRKRQRERNVFERRRSLLVSLCDAWNKKKSLQSVASVCVFHYLSLRFACTAHHPNRLDTLNSQIQMQNCSCVYDEHPVCICLFAQQPTNQPTHTKHSKKKKLSKLEIHAHEETTNK